MAKVFLSTVIVTFNSRGFIKECLSSVFAQDYRDLEVIVVDNGSSDGSVNFIKEKYPRVVLIENTKNLGSCKARNQGIEIAQGEWILTLDCDIVLEKDFLRKITEYAKRPCVLSEIFQPKILRNDKKTIYSCGIYISYLRRFYDIGKNQSDNGKFNISKLIFGACSAAALYKRTMLEEIKESTGYFDERFFFLVEDVDLSWRAQKKGYKALYVPGAVCYHNGNSSKTPFRLRQFLCFKNRHLMIKKNESLVGKIKLIILGFWYESARFIYLLLSNKCMLVQDPRILHAS